MAVLAAVLDMPVDDLWDITGNGTTGLRLGCW